MAWIDWVIYLGSHYWQVKELEVGPGGLDPEPVLLITIPEGEPLTPSHAANLVVEPEPGLGLTLGTASPELLTGGVCPVI